MDRTRTHAYRCILPPTYPSPTIKAIDYSASTCLAPANANMLVDVVLASLDLLVEDHQDEEQVERVGGEISPPPIGGIREVKRLDFGSESSIPIPHHSQPATA